MTARQKIHQLQIQEWTARFSEQRASGMTATQWCEQNHLSIHKYNYWKHQVKEAVTDQLLPDIAPLMVSASAPVCPSNQAPLTTHAITDESIAARITFNGFSVDLSQNISESLLFTIIKAVRYV